MNRRIYIETSIFGYLTARLTNDLVVATNIKITQDWWDSYYEELDIYVSEMVEDEVAQGDQEISSQRLKLVQNLTYLDLTEETIELAQKFLQRSNLPIKATNDCLHRALATIYNMDYWLTWNCKHMANVQIQRKLAQISSEAGYNLPFISSRPLMIPCLTPGLFPT